MIDLQALMEIAVAAIPLVPAVLDLWKRRPGLSRRSEPGGGDPLDRAGCHASIRVHLLVHPGAAIPPMRVYFVRFSGE